MWKYFPAHERKAQAQAQAEAEAEAETDKLRHAATVKNSTCIFQTVWSDFLPPKWKLKAAQVTVTVPIAVTVTVDTCLLSLLQFAVAFLQFQLLLHCINFASLPFCQAEMYPDFWLKATTIRTHTQPARQAGNQPGWHTPATPTLTATRTTDSGSGYGYGNDSDSGFSRITKTSARFADLNLLRLLLLLLL